MTLPSRPNNLSFDQLFQIIDQVKTSGELMRVAGVLTDAQGRLSGSLDRIGKSVAKLNTVKMSGDGITALADRTTKNTGFAQRVADKLPRFAKILEEASGHTDSTWQNMVALKQERDAALHPTGIMRAYGIIGSRRSPEVIEENFTAQAWDDHMSPWAQHISDVAREISAGSQQIADTIGPMSAIPQADPGQPGQFDRPLTGDQPHAQPGPGPGNDTKAPPGTGTAGGPDSKTPQKGTATNAGNPMSNNGSSPGGSSSASPGGSQSSSPGGGMSSSPGSTGSGSPTDLSMAGTPTVIPADSTTVPTFPSSGSPVSTPTSTTPLTIPSITPFKTLPVSDAKVASASTEVPVNALNSGVVQRPASGTTGEPGLPPPSLAGNAAPAQPGMGPMPYMPGMGGMGGMGAGAGASQIRPGVAQQPGSPGLGVPGAPGTKPKRLGVRPELAGRTDGGRPGQPAGRPAPSRKRRKDAASREVLDEELWKVAEKLPPASASRGSGRR
jgi:hypothetical protein